MAKNSLRITFYVFIGCLIVMALAIYYCASTTDGDDTPKEPEQPEQGLTPPDTI